MTKPKIKYEDQFDLATGELKVLPSELVDFSDSDKLSALRRAICEGYERALRKGTSSLM